MTIDDQLHHWAANAKADINQQVKKQYLAAGYTEKQLKDGKVTLRFEVQKGQREGFNQFNYFIVDNRLFKSKRKNLCTVEFSNAGYVIFVPEPKIKPIEKPAIVNLAGEKIKSGVKKLLK